MKRVKHAASQAGVLLFVTLVALNFFNGCKNSTGPSGPSTNEVWIKDNLYDPDTLSVPQNTTVTWKNRDPHSHTVTSDDPGLFASPLIGVNGLYTHTFDSAGTFGYSCTVVQGMHGVIIVTSPSGPQVSIVNSTYVPDTITVMQGATVTWKNNDLLTHTVTSDAGYFNSGVINGGGQWSYVFASAGTFPYHCTIHTNMHGVVVVLASGGGPGSNEVWMQNNQYNPAIKTISAGTSIIFVNLDDWAHTVTSGIPENPSGLFDSGPIPPGEGWVYTFADTGAFQYYDAYFQFNMTGTMIVQ